MLNYLRKTFLTLFAALLIGCLSGCRAPGPPDSVVPAPQNLKQSNFPAHPLETQKPANSEPILKLELDQKTKQKIVESEIQTELLGSQPEPIEESALDKTSSTSDVLTRLQLGLENDTPVVGYKFKQRSTSPELPDVFPTPLSNATTGNIKEGKLQVD